jgi:hydrophobic/amphiphilic exporter-1 (mainly G- bacteria), HAE1 family
MIAIVQLPDGASLERTQKTLDRVFEIARKTPGVARVVTIAGVSPLDNSATGVAYVILEDWSASGAGASARTSIGITVFTGMIASTCLAVLFVPPFFVVAQHFEEWRRARKSPSPAHTPAE